MYCKNCGKELVDGMKSCPFCNTLTNEKIPNQSNQIYHKPNNNTNITTNDASALAALIVLIILITLGYLGVKFVYNKFHADINVSESSYTKTTAEMLLNEWEENEAAFKDNYEGKYVSIYNAEIKNIDSNLIYIDIRRWLFIIIHDYMLSTE